MLDRSVDRLCSRYTWTHSGATLLGKKRQTTTYVSHTRLCTCAPRALQMHPCCILVETVVLVSHHLPASDGPRASSRLLKSRETVVVAGWLDRHGSTSALILQAINTDLNFQTTTLTHSRTNHVNSVHIWIISLAIVGFLFRVSVDALC